MRKNLLLAYFYDLCILISFSLLTITVRGVSNRHCLLPFFCLFGMLILGVQNYLLCTCCVFRLQWKTYGRSDSFLEVSPISTLPYD